MKRRMYRSEAEMLRHLNGNVQAYEMADEQAPSNRMGSAFGVEKAKYNPKFSAQFDIEFVQKYFTVAAGVYTEVAAAAINAALKTKLPAFLFGNSDFAGAFVRLRQQFVLTGGWVYEDAFIAGKDVARSSFGNFSANALAVLVPGDLVLVTTSTVGGVNTVGLSIIRSSQVSYGTLLGSLVSDLFTINLIRYVSTDLNQFKNDIKVFDQSLFGKTLTDFISPNSWKVPEQQQNDLIDIGITKKVTKETAFATFKNYDVVSFTWSIFVDVVTKL